MPTAYRQRLLVFFAFVSCAILLSLRADAASLRSPGDLLPGDKYRLAFVTDGRLQQWGKSNEDYNEFVTREAHRAGSLVADLTVEWKAIASTKLVDARDNTGTNPTLSEPNEVPVYLVDGTTRIADNYADLWDGSLDAPLNIDQFGRRADTKVATGTREDGTAWPIFYLGRFYYGGWVEGVSAWTSGWWVSSNTVLTWGPEHFYAMSDLLTVVPEPTSATLVGLAIAAGLWPRRVQVRRNHRYLL